MNEFSQSIIEESGFQGEEQNKIFFLTCSFILQRRIRQTESNRYSDLSARFSSDVHFQFRQMVPQLDLEFQHL